MRYLFFCIIHLDFTNKQAKMNIPSAIFRAYDIRGVVGETLTEAQAYTVGRGFATLVAPRGSDAIEFPVAQQRPVMTTNAACIALKQLESSFRGVGYRVLVTGEVAIKGRGLGY